MGKGNNRKRDRRIAEVNTEVEDAIIERNIAKTLASRENSLLYTVDRSGSKNARRRVEKEVSTKSTKNSVSKVEHHLIKKKLANMTKQNTTVAVTLNNKKMTAASVKSSAAIKNQVEAFDPWGDDITTTTPNPDRDIGNKLARGTGKGQGKAVLPIREDIKKSLKVDAPGFSYNPDEEQHQDLVAEALAVELEHLEKKARSEGAFSDSIKNASHAGAITNPHNSGENFDDEDDSDDSDDSDNSDNDGFSGDEDNTNNPRKLSRKQRKNLEKKTRAQRNKEKQKRRNIADEMLIQKMNKLIKGLKQVPKMLNEMDKAKKTSEAKKALKEIKEAQETEENSKKMTYKEAGQVPLSDELSDTLRTLRPKGNIVSGMMTSLIKSGDATSKDYRNKKKGEHPHKAQNIKWIAKYKYNDNEIKYQSDYK